MVTSLPKEGSPLPPLIHPEKELKLDSSLKRSAIHGHGPQRQSYLRLAKDVAVLGGPLRRSTFPEFRVSEVSKPPSASSSQPSRYPGCHGDRTGAELESVRGSSGPCTLLGRCSLASPGVLGPEVGCPAWAFAGHWPLL